MKIHKFVLIVVLSYFNAAFGQLRWDATIEQKPYINNIPYDKTVQLPIKTVVHMRNSDTIAIRTYNINGKLKEHVDFVEGKRANKYNYSYSTNQEAITNLTYSNKRLSGGTIKYTDDGKRKEIYNYQLTQNRDTVEINKQRGIYSYNKAGQLLKSTNEYDGNSMGENYYLYEGGLLVKARIQVHPLKKSETQYRVTYNSEKLPKEIGVYIVSGKEVVQESINKYTYNYGKLVEEKYTLKGDPAENITKYEYTDTGNIQRIVLRRDQDSLHVSYKYDLNGRLTHKETEATNYLYHKGIMFVPPGVSMPYSGLDKYKYDENGSLVEVMNFIDRQATAIERYIIDYFR